MKKIILILLVNFALVSCKIIDDVADSGILKDGDIIFHTSQSAQSKAIQAATHSKYSHCGIIYKEGNDYFVFEAVQPVKKTPLQDWIDRGKDDLYSVRRLKDADKILTPQALAKMKASAKAMTGKNYDLYFEWSDNRIYCSELVWKIYKDGTGLEVGHLQKLRDFDLSNPAVKQKLKERYGNNIPLNEKVISPSALYNSDLLETVVEKYRTLN